MRTTTIRPLLLPLALGHVSCFPPGRCGAQGASSPASPVGVPQSTSPWKARVVSSPLLRPECRFRTRFLPNSLPHSPLPLAQTPATQNSWAPPPQESASIGTAGGTRICVLEGAPKELRQAARTGQHVPASLLISCRWSPWGPGGTQREPGVGVWGSAPSPGGTFLGNGVLTKDVGLCESHVASRWRQRPGNSFRPQRDSQARTHGSMLGRGCSTLVTSDPRGTHQGCSAGHAAERFGQVWALQLELLQELLGQANVHGQREPLTDVLQGPGRHRDSSVCCRVAGAVGPRLSPWTWLPL